MERAYYFPTEGGGSEEGIEDALDRITKFCYILMSAIAQAIVFFGLFMNSVYLEVVLGKRRTVVLYFVIGASAAVVDYGVFLVLFNFAHVTSVVATTVSIGLATVYGFVLNAKYNFKTDDRLLFRFVSYATVSGIGMLFSIAFLYVFNVRMGYDGNVMKLLSLPFIFAIQYTLNKAISFRKSS